MLAYLDCFAGVGGDVLLGALLDAGLPLDRLQRELSLLELGPFELNPLRRFDHGVAGTSLEIAQAVQPGDLGYDELFEMLRRSRLEPEVVARATAVLVRLARALERASGRSVRETVLPRYRAERLLVEIVGTLVGLRALDVEQLFASPLPVAGGGPGPAGPSPAPVVMELLAEAHVPIRPSSGVQDTVSETGAALVCELARFELPELRLRAVGCGFGDRQGSEACCLRIWLGEGQVDAVGRDEVDVIEANIDDMSPEALGYAMERLFAAGALDVYFQSLQMKKNRPGVLLGVICQPVRTGDLARLVLSETTTLGVRVGRRARLVAGRRVATVQTAFGPVRVKIKELGGRRVAAPEFEDAARIARERRVPLAEVYLAAARAEPEPE